MQTFVLDLFQQSISESGSALSYWGPLREGSADTAKKLAKAANCPTGDSIALVTCLRKLSTPDLQKIYKSITTWINPADYYRWDWFPRVDGELFNQSQLQELRNGKPVIIGVNSLESPIPDGKAFFDPVAKNNIFLAEKNIPAAKSAFNQYLDETFNKSDNILKNDILKQATRYVYLDSKGDRNDDRFVCQQLAKVRL